MSDIGWTVRVIPKYPESALRPPVAEERDAPVPAPEPVESPPAPVADPALRDGSLDRAAARDPRIAAALEVAKQAEAADSTGAEGFGPEALAALGRARRMLLGVVRLVAAGLDDAAGPLAAALFEEAASVMWVLRDPAARAHRYRNEVSRRAVAADGGAGPHAPGYRRISRADTLPTLSQMAAASGLRREHRAMARPARGGSAPADPLGDASALLARFASEVFGRYAAGDPEAVRAAASAFDADRS